MLYEVITPDDPDAGILGHLQAGVLALIEVEQREDEVTAALGVEIGEVLEDDEGSYNFV